MKNVYLERFMKENDKTNFVLKLAEDMIDLLKDEDKSFYYPELMDTIKIEGEYLKLSNGNILCYDDLTICFQEILDGPDMLLDEESLYQFFDLVFGLSPDNFIGPIENELTDIEYNGIKAQYYTQIRYDGVIFTGILFENYKAPSLVFGSRVLDLVAIDKD